MCINEENYPKSLGDLPVWVLWRLERDSKERIIKVPYSPHYYGRASTTDPKTWGTFREAIQRHESRPSYYCGVGIAISKEYGLVFIDIDHCVDKDGTLNRASSDIVALFEDQYIEFSQSGAGIHIITMGEIPKNVKSSHSGVEIYNDKRYCALTGNIINNGELKNRQAEVDLIYKQHATTCAEKKPVRLDKATRNNDDDWVVSKATGHGHFDELYSGAWELAGYSSQSEADLALCMILAFWTDRNPEQMDRIFRSSGLFREKWERNDYKVETLHKAMSLCEETISEFKRREIYERGERFDKELRAKWDEI